MNRIRYLASPFGAGETAGGGRSGSGDMHRPISRILVAGVGGAGGNIVRRFTGRKIEGVYHLFVNTCRAALERIETDAQAVTLCIGEGTTGGRGAGSRTEMGRRAAVESEQALRAALQGADLVVIAAGMGGGTATGAAPVIAKCCRELGIMVVAVVSMPFSFEGTLRARHAELGAKVLSAEADGVVVVDDDDLLELSGKKTQFFKLSDEVLGTAIAEVISICRPTGEVDIELEEVKSVFSQGVVRMGLGSSAAGEMPRGLAGRRAADSPLIPAKILKHATHAIVSITGDASLEIDEINEITSSIRERLNARTNISMCLRLSEETKGYVQVALFVAGHRDVGALLPDNVVPFRRRT